MPVSFFAKQYYYYLTTDTMQHSTHKGTLYQSQLPFSETQAGRNGQNRLKMSLINLGASNVTDHYQNGYEGKSLSYRYKRENNMFKLVEVMSNCQQVREKNSRIDQICQNIEILKHRVTELETKANREDMLVDAVRQEITWLAQTGNENQAQINHQTKQIGELRERIEQIEEEQSYHNRIIAEINNKIDQIVHCPNPNLPDNNFGGLLDEKISVCTQQIIKQIESIKNRLSCCELRSPKTSQSSSTDLNPFSLNRSQIKLKYSQIYEDLTTNNSYLIDQNVYCVDSQGRILDSEGYRILGPRHQEIKLDCEHIRKLRDFGILR